MKIAVLGAGMVGRAIARDLSGKYKVTCFDINKDNLQLLPDQIDKKQVNLSSYADYPAYLQDFTYVISAVPGFMGFATLQKLIELQKQIVDISFFPEDALTLQSLAEKNGVTAIVDCGVAPGMSNFILGRVNAEMKINSFECMVGGLPKVRTQPFEYKAPFSPIDVIEEYTRPARYVENGHIITRPALSDPELIEFEQVGTLESFNTDGLRSILFTMKHIPNLKEKTLRYPGHISLIRSLQKAGFFSEATMKINDKVIRPIDVTNAILFNQWKLGAEECEFTIMLVKCIGEKNDKKSTVQYELYDEYDPLTKISSMSRTTGYTCSAAMHLLINQLFTKKGVFPPELIGNDINCFNFVINYLKERNINWIRKEY